MARTSIPHRPLGTLRLGFGDSESTEFILRFTASRPAELDASWSFSGHSLAVQGAWREGQNDERALEMLAQERQSKMNCIHMVTNNINGAASRSS